MWDIKRQVKDASEVAGLSNYKDEIAVYWSGDDCRGNKKHELPSHPLPGGQFPHIPLSGLPAMPDQKQQLYFLVCLSLSWKSVL